MARTSVIFPSSHLPPIIRLRSMLMYTFEIQNSFALINVPKSSLEHLIQLICYISFTNTQHEMKRAATCVWLLNQISPYHLYKGLYILKGYSVVLIKNIWLYHFLSCYLY